MQPPVNSVVVYIDEMGPKAPHTYPGPLWSRRFSRPHYEADYGHRGSGGYIGTLARVRGYQTLRLKVGTILKNLDLAQSDDHLRRVSQTREKMERALDRLSQSEIGVISSWKFANCPAPNEPDMDDVDALSEYGQNETYPEGDWRGWIVEIELPFEQDALRLDSSRKKAAETAKRRAGRKSEVVPTQPRFGT